MKTWRISLPHSLRGWSTRSVSSSQSNAAKRLANDSGVTFVEVVHCRATASGTVLQEITVP